MMNKKSSILVAAVVTVFSFMMITWLSCSKPSQPYSCNGTVCINGGHCYQDTLPPHKPHCACPSGFEGTTCATPSVNKFIGYWNVRHHIVWSDSVGYAGSDSIYVMQLKKTATNTTFFMYNLFNNPNYDNIVCHIDSTVTDYFTVDTLANFNMFFNAYRIDTAAYGTIYGRDSIIVHMVTHALSGSTNRRKDSVTLHMWPHN